MIFRNEIRFKHGTLKRGEECLVRTQRCIYLGSYKDHRTTNGEPFIHLMKVIDTVPTVILEVNRVSDITCSKQSIPKQNNQLELV